MRPPESSKPDEVSNAVKTWRYLRLGMVVLVIGLGVSVVLEVIRVNCVQTSLSAYYYTPVQSVFVAALVAIGVSLFCLRGNNNYEDALLNLAGMFAPVVAFVPTGLDERCASQFDETFRKVNVENNMWTLLIAGSIAGVILLVRSKPHTYKGPAGVGWKAAGLLWMGALGLFLFARDFFVAHAHTWSAIPMFVCIFFVVAINAWARGKAPEGRKVAGWGYIGIAGAMVAAVLLAIATWLADWKYTVIGIEGAMIALFAGFWIIQTIELWSQGLREPIKQ